MGDGPPPCPDLPDLDEALLGLVKPELAPGERLIWAARSRIDRGRLLAGYLRAFTWLASLFVFSVACFAILTMRLNTHEAFVGTLTILGTTAFATWLVVGLLVGLKFLADLIRAWRAVPDVYAVTDRRAIVWAASGTRGAVDVAITPRGSIRATNIRRTQFPDGSGDLHFGDYRPHSSFRWIDDVRGVEIPVRTYLMAPPDESAPEPF